MDTGVLAAQGFVLVRAAISERALETLGAAAGTDEEESGVRRRRGQAFAVRHLLRGRPGLAPLLAEGGLDRLAAEALGGEALAVDATLFDKVPAANWKVASHQDLVFPVESAPASWRPLARGGVLYVEPPVEVLRALVTLRVHLDDCPADNGALAVIPGSHLGGRLGDEEADRLAAAGFVVCEARRGDVLIMSPLLVHRSSAARTARHRRVVQVVYARNDAATGVRWWRAG